MTRMHWWIVLGSVACTSAADKGDFDTESAGATTGSSDGSGSNDSTGGASGTASTSSADTSGGNATLDTGTTDSSDDGPGGFDVNMIPDLRREEGCSAVDFLFVIDDSSSMFQNQQNLVANFPTFIDGIESTLVDVESYQVGIVATDAFSGNPGPCILLGALITSTDGAGPESSDMDCGPYADGFNYMTEQDDLATTFSCAAQVGTMGSGFERPMEAMVTTVGKTLGDVGECNEGFLRDEALLVIVVITDEYDGEGDPEAPGNGREPPNSTGTPQTWYDAVVAAKNGHPENATALAILNYEGGPCEPPDLGHDGVHIVEWVELFGANGFLGGICEEDYGPFFEQATQVVADACANFVPEG